MWGQQSKAVKLYQQGSVMPRWGLGLCASLPPVSYSVEGDRRWFGPFRGCHSTCSSSSRYPKQLDHLASWCEKGIEVAAGESCLAGVICKLCSSSNSSAVAQPKKSSASLGRQSRAPIWSVVSNRDSSPRRSRRCTCHDCKVCLHCTVYNLITPRSISHKQKHVSLQPPPNFNPRFSQPSAPRCITQS